MARSHSPNLLNTDLSPPHPTPGSSVAEEAPRFETALAELERLVQSMETGQLPLEDALAAYQRGSELLRHCQQQLAEAEQKIQLFEENGLRDFDPAEGDVA